jgi:hypothetical protein
VATLLLSRGVDANAKENANGCGRVRIIRGSGQRRLACNGKGTAKGQRRRWRAAQDGR